MLANVVAIEAALDKHGKDNSSKAPKLNGESPPLCDGTPASLIN